MIDSLQSALCCWSSQQQSPPASPVLPRRGPSATSATACTCTATHSSPHNEKAALADTATTPPCGDTKAHEFYTSAAVPIAPIHSDQDMHRSMDEKPSAHGADAGVNQPRSLRTSSPTAQHRRTNTAGSVSSTLSTSSASRGSYLRGFLTSVKKSPTTEPPSTIDSPIITSSSSHYRPHHSPHDQQPMENPLSKSPSKQFSLQKFYYPKNTMTAAAASTSSPSSPVRSSFEPSRPSLESSPTTFKAIQGSFSRMDTGSTGPLAPPSFAGPRALANKPFSAPTSIPSFTASISPLSSVPQHSSPPSLSLTTAPEPGSILPWPSPSSISTSTPALVLSAPPPPPPPFTSTPLMSLPSMPVSIPTKFTSPSPMGISTSTNILAPALSPLEPSLSGTVPSSPPTNTLSLHPFSLANLSTSCASLSSSSVSSVSATSSPNTSPSNSPIETTSSSNNDSQISSPARSDLTPYPACSISAAQLAAMMERVSPEAGSVGYSKGVSAGSRRPLVLDLRPNPDFDPLSIVHSININLPTLLMRRYRRGGAVSSFALESFITMPSDKELFHQIQDSWRQDLASEVHDVVVLDQDMGAGKEDFGRSPSPAWTLVNVLERGGGNLGGPIRLWYLEGGFEAFQAWDLREKYLTRPGSELLDAHATPQQQGQEDIQMTFTEHDGSSGKVHPFSMPLSLPSSSSVSSSSSTIVTDAKTAQAIDTAVSLTTASLGGTSHRQRGAPVRRESLFSLNTKSLPRPAGLSRAQTIGVSALNIKPLSIPSLNTSLHPLHEGNAQPMPPMPSLENKGSWLTVPNGGSGGGVGPLSLPAHSPTLSLPNQAMEIHPHSALTGPSSAWSANSPGLSINSSINGDASAAGQPLLRSLSKKSFASTTTLSSLHLTHSPIGIQEEDEPGLDANHPNLRRQRSGPNSLRSIPLSLNAAASPTRAYFDVGSSEHDGYKNNNNNNNNSDNSAAGFHQEYQARMFSEGIDSYTNNSSMASIMNQHLYQHYQHQGYDDEFAEENGDNGEQEISCILPNFLYLGPEIVTEEQVQQLEQLGIKRVLNMARECEDLLVSQRAGIEYHKIGVLDNVEEDVSPGLLEAVDIISASVDAPIYVHCKAGKSRSVTATIAYLITQLHWSLNKAYNHVLTQRPCMCPNIGFVTELMQIEERTLGTERAGGLVRAGSLNSILSLSTAGSGLQQHHHHHHHHHSLQHHPSLSKSGSPKGLSAKSSVNNFAILQ
ncbi:hypothetical protein BGZ67_009143 [Mortierella alpina]|nr:hypothetical protein BGZ67_009143 [Mortierella alpina]